MDSSTSCGRNRRIFFVHSPQCNGVVGTYPPSLSQPSGFGADGPGRPSLQGKISNPAPLPRRERNWRNSQTTPVARMVPSSWVGPRAAWPVLFAKRRAGRFASQPSSNSKSEISQPIPSPIAFFFIREHFSNPTTRLGRQTRRLNISATPNRRPLIPPPDDWEKRRYRERRTVPVNSSGTPHPHFFDHNR